MPEKCSHRRRHDGFTLVELLVAVLVVGILTAIAVPVFKNQKASAHDRAVEAQLATVAKTIESTLDDAATFSGDDTQRAIVANGQTHPVPTSDGVTWQAFGTPQGYCITASHPGGRVNSTTTPRSYDSTRGGLLDNGEDCADSTVLAWYATGGHGTGPIRNLLRNPSQEMMGLWNWNPQPGVVVSSSWTSDTLWGGVARRVTFTEPADRSGVGFYQTVAEFKPDTTYTASMWVRASIDQYIQVRAELTDLNNVRTTRSAPSELVPAGKWHRLHFTFTTPSEPLDRIVITGYTGGKALPWPVGATFDADAMLFTEGPTLFPYFDGDTPGARWEGNRSQSISVLG